MCSVIIANSGTFQAAEGKRNDSRGATVESCAFFYSLACYSIGLAGLLVAAVNAIGHGCSQDRRYAAFMACLTLTSFSMTAASYIASSGRADALAIAFTSLAGIFGSGLLVFILPWFIHSLVALRRERALNRLWGGLSILTFGIGISYFLFPRSGLSFALIPAAMCSSVVYAVSTMLAVGASAKRWRFAGLAESDRGRWRAMARFLPVLSLVFLPAFAIIDFFPSLSQALFPSFPSAFRAFPLFYAILNCFYAAKALPLLVKARRERGDPVPERPASVGRAWDFEGGGLSPRERQVACLLLEGMTYQRISERLFISLATVKTHVDRIYKKSGAANKMDLARIVRGA